MYRSPNHIKGATNHLNTFGDYSELCVGKERDTNETRSHRLRRSVGEVDDIELKVGCESAHGDMAS